jgi:hypothetical protein
LLDYMAAHFLKKVSIWFSIVVVLAKIPTSSVWRFLFPRHPCKHLLLVVFLMIAILTGVRWNLSVVLICISFTARDGEHSFHVFFSRVDFFLSVQLPISLLGHWFFFWSLVFWAPWKYTFSMLYFELIWRNLCKYIVLLMPQRSFRYTFGVTYHFLVIIYFYPKSCPLFWWKIVKNTANHETICCGKWVRIGYCFLLLSFSHLHNDLHLTVFFFFFCANIDVTGTFLGNHCVTHILICDSLFDNVFS